MQLHFGKRIEGERQSGSAQKESSYSIGSTKEAQVYRCTRDLRSTHMQETRFTKIQAITDSLALQTLRSRVVISPSETQVQVVDIVLFPHRLSEVHFRDIDYYVHSVASNSKVSILNQPV